MFTYIINKSSTDSKAPKIRKLISKLVNCILVSQTYILPHTYKRRFPLLNKENFALLVKQFIERLSMLKSTAISGTE